MSETLSIQDALRQKNDNRQVSDAIYPSPITITFQPKENIRYSSRFRFVCEYGNNFDVILQGNGTYEEHEHKPLRPMPSL